jgi:hypothetical protein
VHDRLDEVWIVTHDASVDAMIVSTKGNHGHFHSIYRSEG